MMMRMIIIIIIIIIIQSPVNGLFSMTDWIRNSFFNYWLIGWFQKHTIHDISNIQSWNYYNIERWVCRNDEWPQRPDCKCSLPSYQSEKWSFTKCMNMCLVSVRCPYRLSQWIHHVGNTWNYHVDIWLKWHIYIQDGIYKYIYIYIYIYHQGSGKV